MNKVVLKRAGDIDEQLQLQLVNRHTKKELKSMILIEVSQRRAVPLRLLAPF
jgi:hypothetical protein